MSVSVEAVPLLRDELLGSARPRTQPEAGDGVLDRHAADALPSDLGT